MINQKLPEPGEWWISYCDAIAYICGFDPDGDPVFLTDRKENAHVDTMSGFLENWHHEPLCTGWDWKPPAPIDPGEGWEVLPKRVLLIAGDQVRQDGGDWLDTVFVGDEANDACIYRRRKPPAEMWPKYVICDTWVLDAYIRRDSATVATGIKMDGKPFRNPYEWSEFEDGLILQGKWRYVTKSEAIDRVKPAEPIAAERIPDNRPAREVDVVLLPCPFCGSDAGYCTSTHDHGIDHIVVCNACPAQIETRRKERSVAAWNNRDRCTEKCSEDTPPFAKPFTNARSGMGIQKEPVESIRQAAERTAVPLVAAVIESPDDWVTQDRVLARDGIDQRRYTYSDGTKSPWDDCSCMNWGRQVMHGESIGCQSGGYVELRCKRKDLPSVESPDDWVETTDPGYELRDAVDEVPTGIAGQWQKVALSRGILLGDSIYNRARCRRRDLPAPQTKRIPVRLFVSADVRWGDRYIVSVKDGNPNPERHQEIKFDRSGFYVEGE